MDGPHQPECGLAAVGKKSKNAFWVAATARTDWSTTVAVVSRGRFFLRRLGLSERLRSVEGMLQLTQIEDDATKVGMAIALYALARVTQRARAEDCTDMQWERVIELHIAETTPHRISTNGNSQTRAMPGLRNSSRGYLYAAC